MTAKQMMQQMRERISGLRKLAKEPSYHKDLRERWTKMANAYETALTEAVNLASECEI
jgi:hypothetical protein